MFFLLFFIFFTITDLFTHNSIVHPSTFSLKNEVSDNCIAEVRFCFPLPPLYSSGLFCEEFFEAVHGFYSGFVGSEGGQAEVVFAVFAEAGTWGSYHLDVFK